MFVDFTRQLHQYLSWRSSCNDFNQDLGVSEGIPFCDTVQALKHVCLILDYPFTYTNAQTFRPPFMSSVQKDLTSSYVKNRLSIPLSDISS
jgi:hypothetical protein